MTQAGDPGSSLPSAGALPLRRRVAFALVTLLIAAAALEIVLRLALPVGTRLAWSAYRQRYTLQAYQQWDRTRDVVTHVPSQRLTWDDLQRDAASRQGSRPAAALGEVAAKSAARADEVIIAINAAGLRGEDEVDATHARPRVLCLGDSCTFGRWSRMTYPRALSQALAARGIAAEVLNGGVEGYSTRDVCARLDELAALRPQITILFIGWNDLYAQHPTAPLYSSLAIARTIHLLGHALHRAAGGQTPKDPRRDATEVAALAAWEPDFLPRIETIVDRMQAAGSEVVLCTLPGLFTTHETPSARALEMGHLPSCVDNPFVLATMTERTNACIRALAARRGLRVIDLEAMARVQLQPRDAFFFDSVHLLEPGLERIGRAVAEGVAPEAGRGKDAR